MNDALVEDAALTKKSLENSPVPMVERTGHRLRDLNGKGGRGILGRAVVLTWLIGKFCLQKKIVETKQ